MLERIVLADEKNAVESVLDEHAAMADDDDLVVELIYNEYLIREERGDSPVVQEYVNRFPDHEGRIQRLFSIHATLDSEQHLSRLESESSPLPRLLTPGDIVGPFELLSSLGSGGRGFVFQARQVDLDRIVALKVLKVNAADDREVARFLVEAKATAKLLHPNIVQVYESDIYENLPYIALEYVAGGTLEERLSGGPIGANDAAELLAVLAGALQYAHDQGVVHRDVKPSNILLTEAGTPKVTDFGLAKRSQFSKTSAPQSLTETGALLGTPSYMAPEQAEGRNRDVGPATDVYGLGVVLYELITGTVPFVGESTLDVLQGICAMDPVAPSLRNPKVPRDLETICLKCLEKETTSRYASAADLADDLNRFLTGRSIVAQPSSMVRRFSKLARRHPLTTTLVVGLVISMLAVFAVISWQWNQATIGARTQALLRNAAEDALYSNQLALAHKEIKSSESQRALEILNSTDRSRRHWEWEYLKQSFDTYATLATLGSDTRRCVLSFDGSLLAVVKGRWGTDEPGRLSVFDAETRETVFTTATTFGPIMDVGFSPDGQTIATVETRFAAGGGLISFYHAHSGELQRAIPRKSTGLYAVAYHPSLPKVALATEKHAVEIWDLESEERLLELHGHQDTCYRVAFSPTGKQLASCSGDGTIRLWNTENGNEEGVLRAQKDLMKVAYTPDGRYIVANGNEQAIQYWDRLQDPPRHTKVHLAGDHPLSYDLSVSPHGRHFLAFGDGGRRLFSYDVAVERLSYRLAGTLNRPFWLACHPNKDRLYVVDADGNVMESNARPVNPYQRFVTASATAFAFNAEKDVIAIASGTNRVLPGRRDFRCRLLPLSEIDAEIRFFEGAPTWVSSIALSPDGAILACGCEDGTVLQWSTNTGTLLVKGAFHESDVIHLSFPESGNRLTSVSSDGWVASWKGTAEEPSSKLRLPTSAIRNAAFNSNGNRLLVSNIRGSAALYAVRPEVISDGTRDSVAGALTSLWQTHQTDLAFRTLAVSPTGQHVALANGNSLDLWSLNEAERVPAWSVAMPLTAATDLAFHPDGLRLAVVDGWVGRVMLYDTANGQLVLELNTRSGNDRANLAFSPDGKRLLATVGGELYVWNSSNLKPATELFNAPTVNKSRLRTDFQWHVNQASAQIYGGLPFGAEFHSRRALGVLDRHGSKLQGMPALEVLALNAKCHLAKSLIDLGHIDQGKKMFQNIVAECPDQYTSLHTIGLLLATYPGTTAVSPETLQEMVDKALQFKPTDSNALATSGLASLRNGNIDQARGLLEQAAKTMTSWEGLVLFPLSVVEARSDNQKEANRLFDRGSAWMESSATTPPILRELQRRAAEELGR